MTTRTIASAAAALLCALTGVAASATNWYATIKRENMPTYALKGEPFSATFSITNTDATESINSIAILYAPTGGTSMTVTHTMSEPVEPGTTATETIDGFICDAEGETVYSTYTLSAVNGEANLSGSYTYNYMLCASEIIPRNVVMEETTSITCGYCPRGLVAFDYLNEKYPDGSWLGVSIHTNDMLYTPAYADYLKKVGTSTPRCTVNRDFSSSIGVYYLSMEDTYLQRRAYPAFVSISAEAEPQSTDDPTHVTVKSSARFVFDRSNEYRFAYTVTENNVGPYPQYNYYSGSSNDEGGWEKKASTVATIFSDIPRDGTIYAGVEGSLPEQITAGEVYTTEQSIDVSDVEDMTNAYVTVMVIDGSTMEIANAVRIPLLASTSGSPELSAATEANSVTVSAISGAIRFSRATSARIYSLSGTLVAAPERATEVTLPAGTYIVVPASQPAVKVVL
jgi:hypothetical protein